MKRLIVTLVLVALAFQAGMTAEKVDAEVAFARKVLPLFKVKCLACHGED